MRLEAVSSNSNSASNSTPLVHTASPADKEWPRSRSQTDPLCCPPVQKPHPDRRSFDSAARLSTAASSSLAVLASTSSPISPDNLSDPAFAAFSPRKIHALKSPARTTPTSIPTLLLQTPRTQTTRDLDTLSPTSANNASSFSSSTPPTIASSATSQSLKSQPSLEPKSPLQKRSPASRSACGIETSSGPPPALSTQRTLSQDKPRRASPTIQRPRSFGDTVGSENRLKKPRPASSIDAVLKSDSPTVAASERRQRSSLPVGSTSTITREKGKMALTGTRLSGSFLGTSNRERNSHTIGGGNTDTSSKESLAEDGKSKNEDLFLNIAKANSGRRNSATKPEKKRSKFGLSGLSSRSSRANEETPSPKTSRFDPDQVTPSNSQDNSPSFAYSASTIRSPSSAHHPLDENSRLRYFGVSTRSSIGLPRSRLSRTNREPSPEPPANYTPERRGSGTLEQPQSRTYRQSNLSTMRTPQNPSSSDVAERTRLEVEKSRLDGTESTLSTTAPSTVWDELDDLKSRIRKLELTGKLPPSSAAAMSSVSGERPRTATTTVTTLSSSPKQGRKTTPPPDPESAPPADQIHPLLSTALAKAKSILSPDVYRTLEATATDALTLATLLSSTGSQHSSALSVVNGSGTSDRQVRRKADSLCRGLTELCLALSDEQLTSMPKTRPGSRDASSSQFQFDNLMDRESITPTIAYRRSISHEPEDRGQTATIRLAAGSRLEARRSSILGLNTGSSNNRNTQESSQLSTPTLSTPPSRLNRSSTTLRSRRLQGEDDGDDKTSVSSRPLSRAMTEVNTGTTRYSPRDRRRSREYTSNHPLPDQQILQQLSPPQQQSSQSRATTPGQSALPLRRNYVSPATNLPTASHTNIQPGFRRYGGASLNTGTPAEHSSPHEPVSEGSGTKQGYTGLLQLRPRTNSTGIRRIGIRRPFGTNADGDNTRDDLD